MYETWKGRWRIWSRGGASRPPLLLLHGFTGDAESWREVMRRVDSPSVGPSAFRRAPNSSLGSDSLLDPGRTVITLTLPGHEPPSRRSALGMREPQFDAIVDRLAGDLTRILPPPYQVVGYSMGARVAIGLLARHRELFARAVLVGGHPGLESGPERKKRMASDDHWAERITAEGLENFVDAWEEQPIFATQEELSFEARNAQRSLRVSHAPEGLAWAMRYLGLGRQPSYWEALVDLDLPVDVVVGEHDEKFQKISKRMVSTLPRATLYRIAGCGHNVVLEAPDAIADLIHERKPSCLASNGSRSSATKTSATKKPKSGRRTPPANPRH